MSNFPIKSLQEWIATIIICQFADTPDYNHNRTHFSSLYTRYMFEHKTRGGPGRSPLQHCHAYSTIFIANMWTDTRRKWQGPIICILVIYLGVEGFLVTDSPHLCGIGIARSVRPKTGHFFPTTLQHSQWEHSGMVSRNIQQLCQKCVSLKCRGLQKKLGNKNSFGFSHV